MGNYNSKTLCLLPGRSRTKIISRNDPKTITLVIELWLTAFRLRLRLLKRPGTYNTGSQLQYRRKESMNALSRDIKQEGVDYHTISRCVQFNRK